MASTSGFPGNPEDSESPGTSNPREDDVEWDGQVQPEPLHEFANLTSGQTGEVDYFGNFIPPTLYPDFPSSDELMQNMGPPLPVLPNQYLQMNTTTDPYNAANSFGYAPVPASSDGGIWRDGPGTSTQGNPEYSELPQQKRRRKKDVGGSSDDLIQQFIKDPSHWLKQTAFAERLLQLLEETSGSGTTSGHAAGEDEQGASGGQAEQLGMGEPQAGASEDAVETRSEDLTIPKVVKDFLAHPDLYFVDANFTHEITCMVSKQARQVRKNVLKASQAKNPPSGPPNAFSDEQFEIDNLEQFQAFVLHCNFKNATSNLDVDSGEYKQAKKAFLQRIYAKISNPSREFDDVIAKQIKDMNQVQVNRWFLNHRNNLKKKKLN